MKRGSSVWYYIASYCKYSEDNCSSQGELTDFIKYAALCRITGLDTPESNSQIQNYRGLKSKICILGNEKRAQTYVTRLFAYSSRYFRLRWKRRHEQVWCTKSSWDKLFQVIPVGKRLLSVSVYLSVCLSVCLSACLPVCLSVCLSVLPSIHPSIRLFNHSPSMRTSKFI